MHPEPRLAYRSLIPGTVTSLAQASEELKKSSLGPVLIGLVDLRVSQLNGCGYCVDLHWRELMALGQDPRRLNGVAGWHESPFFDARERAALKWAEIVTNIAQRPPTDAEFEALKAHFNDTEIAQLTAAIALINAWNRFGVSFRVPVRADVQAEVHSARQAAARSAR